MRIISLCLMLGAVLLAGQLALGAEEVVVYSSVDVDAQNAITDAKTYFFPVHPKAKLAKGLPAFDQIPVTSYDAVWAGESKKRLVDRWINEVLRAPK